MKERRIRSTYKPLRRVPEPAVASSLRNHPQSDLNVADSTTEIACRLLPALVLACKEVALTFYVIEEKNRC
jgi:hypothetical protein